MRMRLLVPAVVMVCLLPACGAPAGPATLEYVEMLPAQPKIGDVATVRFRLLDSRGVPLAGSTVNFTLGSENTGITLSPPTAISIKGNGYAETQIVANARVNSVVVIATSGDKRVTSPPLTFAGSVANGRQFTFQCGPLAGDGSGGRHAIGAYDSSRHLIAGSSLDCTAHVGDRNGDGITDALVSFMTEAGTIGATGLSKADLVGDATVKYKTSLPLPAEVMPGQFAWDVDVNNLNNTGEYFAPLWMQPFNWTENPRDVFPAPNTVFNKREPRRPDPIRFHPDGTRYENNPRDNLVSLIAITSGEEGFTDSDNDGVYDSTEQFDDLTEPFVDSNDDGTWNDNERFIDVNGNGQWNGKNGKWDANTLIWRQERILWTGFPAEEDTFLNVQGVTGHRSVFSPAGPNPITLLCPAGGGSQCAAAGPPALVTAYLADPWFNSLAQNGESDSCKIDTEDKSPVVAASESGAGVAFTYPAGRYMRFLIKDARDPNAPPADQIPKRVPAIGFLAAIRCTFTSAPQEAYVLKITVGSVSGTIE